MSTKIVLFYKGQKLSDNDVITKPRNWCKICEKKYSSLQKLKYHYKTLFHQHNAAKIIFPDNAKEFSFELKNGQGDIISKTIVDKDVYFHIIKNKYTVTNGKKGYACIIINKKKLALHRFIYYDFYKLNYTIGTIIDHKNCNKLDNRIENLREATRSQNSSNKNKKSNSTSVYYGVTKIKDKYSCQLKTVDINYYFHYNEELHAAYHYDILVKKHNLQEFTRLNNIKKPHDFVEQKKKISNLPKYIRKYMTKHGEKYMYEIKYAAKTYKRRGYLTIQDALTACTTLKNELHLWAEQSKLKMPIVRNTEGIAIIELYNHKKEKTNETLVDDEDYYKLNHYTWYYNGHNNAVLGTVNKKLVKMSRFVMNYDGNHMIDHVDGNPLNNQKSNLRILTAKGNSENRSPKLNNHTSKYIGVCSAKDNNKKWLARINGKYLGIFNSEIDAAKARDKEAIKLNKLGSYYRLNFPI